MPPVKPTDKSVDPAVSKFYAHEDLPPPGVGFDEVDLDSKKHTDSYAAGNADKDSIDKAAAKLPPMAENINVVLAKKFAGRDHYVQIEPLGDKLYYILRWKNGKKARSPIILFEYDESKPPIDTKDFLAFEIGQKEVAIEGKGKMRQVVLKDGNAGFMGQVRHLIIPVNPHESYTNDNGVVNGDAYGYDLYILAGEKGVKERTTTQVNNGGADKTTLYTLNIWSPGDYDIKKPVAATIKPINPEQPKPTLPKEKTTEETKPKKSTGDEEFVKKVIETALKDEAKAKAGGVEVVIAVDISGSMEHAAGLIIEHIADIMKGLKDKGVGKIKVGIVTINVANVKILLPLTKMDDEGLLDLFEKLGTIQMVVGYINLGEAVDKSIKMLGDGDKGAAKSIFVLTDEAALGEDVSLAPYVSDGVAKSEENKIAVNIKTEYDSQSPISIKASAEIQKYLLTEDKSSLLDLAKNASYGYLRVKAAVALAKLGEMEFAKKELLDLAKNASDYYVRVEAAVALAELGEMEFAKKELLDLAKNASDYDVRVEAAVALAKLGEMKVAKETILDVVKNASNNDIRLKAAEVLAELGEMEVAKEAFLYLAMYSCDYDVHVIAVEALAKLGEKAKKELFDLAKNASYHVRMKAATALAKLGEMEFAKKILLDFAKSTSENTRLKAAETLAKLGEEEGRKILLDLAKNASCEYVRLEATKALAKLGDTRGLAILILMNKTWHIESSYYSNEDIKDLEELADEIKKDAGDSAKDIFSIAISIGYNLNTVDEIEDIIEMLLEKFEAEGNSADTIFKNLSRLNPKSIDAFEKYLSLARDVAKKSGDPNIAEKIFGLTSEYISLGYSFEETSKYVSTLLADQKGMVVTMLDNEYQYLPGFIVNETALHYYVNMSKEAGEKKLATLTLNANKEEAWVYVKYKMGGKIYTRFFENGKMEEKGQVTTSTELYASLLSDKSIQIEEIVAYHIHPLGEVKNGVNTQLISSPNDLASAIGKSAWLKKHGYTGPVEFRAVTPAGTYVIKPTGKISGDMPGGTKDKAVAAAYKKWLSESEISSEADVVAGLNESGLVEAEYIYHSKGFSEVIELYKGLLSIRKESFPKAGGYITAAEAAPLHKKLAGHYAKFTSAIDKCESEGLSEKFLKFYKDESVNEYKTITALSKVVASK